MGSASIGSDKLVSEMRVSKNTWLADGSSKLVDKISQRINWITGLQVNVFDIWKIVKLGLKITVITNHKLRFFFDLILLLILS